MPEGHVLVEPDHDLGAELGEKNVASTYAVIAAARAGGGGFVERPPRWSLRAMRLRCRPDRSSRLHASEPFSHVNACRKLLVHAQAEAVEHRESGTAGQALAHRFQTGTGLGTIMKKFAAMEGEDTERAAARECFAVLRTRGLALSARSESNEQLEAKVGHARAVLGTYCPGEKHEADGPGEEEAVTELDGEEPSGPARRGGRRPLRREMFGD